MRFGSIVAFISIICVCVLGSPQLKAVGGGHSTSPSDPAVSKPVPAPQSQEDFERKIHQIRSEAANDPVLGELLRDQMMSIVIVGLNKVVVNFLKTDQDAMKLRPDIEDQLRSIDEEYQNELITSTLKAMPESAPGAGDGQHEDVLKIVQEEMTNLGFPSEVVKNVSVFVDHSNVMNAYTFTGLPQEHVAVVVYEPLVKAMRKSGNDKPLRAVIRHELTHNLKMDIYVQVAVVSIFMATGRDIIPDRPNESLPVDQAIFVEGKLRAFVENLTHKARGEPLSEWEFQMYKNKIRAAVQSIQSKLSREQILAMANRLATRLSAVGLPDKEVQTTLARLDATKNLNAKQTKEFDFKAWMRLMEKLQGIFSNSVEEGADRGVMMASGISPDEAAMADAILLGGSDVNLKAIYRQQRENAVKRMGSARAAQQTMATVEQSHPDLFSRAAAYNALVQTDAWKNWNDSFLRALQDYMFISKAIITLEDRIGQADDPLLKLGTTQVRLEIYKKFAEQLSDAIKSAVVSDLRTKTGEQQILRFTLLHANLKKAVDQAKANLEVKKERDHLIEAWLEDFGGPDRLLADLTEEVKVAPEIPQPLKAKLLEQLDSIRPKPIGEVDRIELMKVLQACHQANGGLTVPTTTGRSSSDAKGPKGSGGPKT